MKLLFATANKGKLREAREILGPECTVVSPASLGMDADVEENGSTLEENSRIKAEAINAASGMDCFADDTGLEVEALGGAPGVLSARYAASFPGGCASHDSEANMARLLEELDKLGPGASRRARFRTVVTLVLGTESYVFEGQVDGYIARERSGSGGFGYDPIFVPDGFGGRTMADISEEEKNSISHRGRALRAMAAFIRSRKNDD